MNEVARILERIACCISNIESSSNVDLTEITDWLNTINDTLIEVTGKSCEDPTFVSVCNPTDLTEVQNLLTSVASKLDEVNDNLGDLEITAEQINLNADQINLSTDEVERLLTTVNTKLDTINSTINDSQKDCDDPSVKPLSVNICNTPVEENYNTPFVKSIISGNTEVMSTNTWHSISVICVKTPVTIIIGANTINMLQGMTLGWTADTLIDMNITISTPSGGEAIITAMN